MRDQETTTTTTSAAMEEIKPQIDLNEFLQQLGILKEDDHDEEKVIESSEENNNNNNNGNLKEDYSNEVEVLSDKSFNWDSIMDMHSNNIGDHHQIGSFQLYDYVNYEDHDLSFPNSIWDFEEGHH